MTEFSRMGKILLVAGMLPLLSACASAVVGGAAAVGVAAVQERSVGNAVDDVTISVDINRRLLERSEKLFTNVGVEVVEGRVLLTGSVEKPEDRVEAAKIAWQAKGVREVLNEIQVTDQSGIINAAKDAWITAQLRAALLADKDVLDINYSIETVNGVIYLIGIAQDKAELEKVTGHARMIKGVKKVVSHVRLKDDPRRRN